MAESTSRKRPGEPPEISTLYAGLGAADADGDEGIVALLSSIGPLPLVFSRAFRLENLAGKAQDLADSSGEVVRFVEFRRVRVVAEFHPRRPS